MSDKTTKHTPTPWVHDLEHIWIKTAGDVHDPDGGIPIARMGAASLLAGSMLESDANCEFIVRSVNSFDAMRKALKNLCKEIEFLVEDETLPQTALDHPSVLAARAALALADKE